MRKSRQLNCFLSFALCPLIFAFCVPSLSSQNITVSFKDASSAPHNLIVCGNMTTVTVSISNTSLDASTLTNTQAKLQLFKGIQLVSFNANQSSSGVTLNDTDKVNPQFSIGTITTGSPIYISYTIRANCDYTDTLTKNNLLDVKDTWQFNFSKSNQSNVTESDFCTSYRDQIRVPYLTMAVSNTAGSNSHVGGLYQRTIKINNSSIDAYLKSSLKVFVLG